MSLFSSPEEHAANPPSSWRVEKRGRKWHLLIHAGSAHSCDSFLTKHQAEAAKTTGFHFDLYQRESRWYAGETIPGWKTYAHCLAERAKLNPPVDTPAHE